MTHTYSYDVHIADTPPTSVEMSGTQLAQEMSAALNEGLKVFDVDVERGRVLLLSDDVALHDGNVDGWVNITTAFPLPELDDEAYALISAVLNDPDRDSMKWVHPRSTKATLRHGDRPVSPALTARLVEDGLVTEAPGADAPARLSLRALMAYAKRKAGAAAAGYGARLLTLFYAEEPEGPLSLHVFASEDATIHENAGTLLALWARVRCADELEDLFTMPLGTPDGLPYAPSTQENEEEFRRGLAHAAIVRAFEIGYGFAEEEAASDDPDAGDDETASDDRAEG